VAAEARTRRRERLGPSDSGGYIASVSCVSMVAVVSWISLVAGVTGLIVVWYLILTT
jgi:hypothetical protein